MDKTPSPKANTKKLTTSPLLGSPLSSPSRLRKTVNATSSLQKKGKSKTKKQRVKDGRLSKRKTLSWKTVSTHLSSLNPFGKK
jgi:hypothetical protein